MTKEEQMYREERQLRAMVDCNRDDGNSGQATGDDTEAAVWAAEGERGAV